MKYAMAASKLSLLLIFAIFSSVAYAQKGKDAAGALRDFPITVHISLSPQAAKALTSRRETIVVLVFYSARPTKAGIAKKIPTDEEGGIPLGEQTFELRKLEDVRLAGPKIPAAMVPYVNDREINLRVSVYSGRHTTKKNFLNCREFDGVARTVAGKSVPIPCKLVGER